LLLTGSQASKPGETHGKERGKLRKGGCLFYTRRKNQFLLESLKKGENIEIPDKGKKKRLRERGLRRFTRVWETPRIWKITEEIQQNACG